MAKPRVVITGIGTVLPGALTVDDFWKNISEGQSQIDFITRFPTDDLSVKVAAELKGFDPKINLPPRLDPKFVDKYSYETLVLMNTLGKCLEDSRLDYEGWEPERVQLFDSSSRSSMYWWDEAYRI
ncbi:MAG TPA: beta-ketoacyl synthase N-terminal-like domain-containing protein, partial [Leptospiraceae bacterium]|nr:beta-ketoacyl synthase N-terminal-like domain-containing protein [Leptospiraceae bacterium]